MHPDDSTLEPGRIIAGYRIERELGRGAMAVVYRAVQLNLLRSVALKVLTPEMAEDEEFVVRFFNEARAAAALSHPNIVQAYDAGVAEDDIYYFAMEYVEGETLLNRINREGFLRPSIGLDIGADIASALGYGFERQQLTHGDIKPENIMLNSSGETKLADFGLAKVQGHDFEGTDIMLTPLYAAPELIQGERCKGDCRADIYSFGATLYHMFAGVPPYPGDEARAVMRRHLAEPLTPLNRRNGAIPKELSAFVGTLLAKSPDDRPQQWDAVGQKIRQLQRSHKLQRHAHEAARLKPTGISRQRAHGASPPSRVTLLLLVGTVLALLGVLLTILWMIDRRSVLTGTNDAASAGPAVTTALPAALAAWNTLRAQVAGIEDPERCVELLEAYGREYLEEAPLEYHERLRQYREAVKWRTAAQAALGVSDEPARDQPPPAAAADGAVGGGGDPGKAAQPRPGEIRALEGEQAGASSLAGPGQSPTGAGDRGGDAAVGLALNANPPRDDYVSYLADVAEFRYALGCTTEPLVAAGQEWLVRYPGASAEAGRIRFIVTIVLPSLQEFHSALLARKEQIIGVRLPTRRYARGRVKDITLTEVLLEETTEHGKLTRGIPWSALDHLGFYQFFGRLAFGDPALSCEERRPYLAMLLITRSFKYFEAALKGLPESDEEVRNWLELRVELEGAPGEGTALALWRQAQEACRSGEYGRAYRHLQELKATRSATGFRYREDIERFEQVCLPHVPHHAAGMSVRRAQRLVATDPQAALATLSLTVARYGNVDFPEKDAIGALREQALASMPSPNVWTKGQPGGLAHFGPFVVWAEPEQWPLALRLWQTLQEDGQPRHLQPLLPVLYGLGLLEAGGWADAHHALAQVPALNRQGLSPAMQMGVLFGRGLLAQRFELEGVDNAAIVGSMRALANRSPSADGGLRLALAATTIEYALAATDPDIVSANVFAWSDLEKGASPADQRKRFLLNALLLLFEDRKADSAVAALARILGDRALLDNCGLNDSERQFLETLWKGLRGGEPVPARVVPDGDPGIRCWRLLLALAMLRPEAVSGIATALPEPERFRYTSPALSGPFLFTGLLCRVQAALAQKDMTSALATVDAVGRADIPPLAAYHPRILFLEAGLLAAAKRMGQARETLELVQLTTVANETEMLLARLWRDDADMDKLRRRLKESENGRFWFAWLGATRAIGGVEARAVAKALDALDSACVSAAHQRLVDGVRLFAGTRSGTDAEGSQTR